ncbi:MAG: M3 family metallopeptidase [Pseudomonadota bacterium]|nr:M3 family metallopeptidase [Pseudomonadota bacterium]
MPDNHATIDPAIAEWDGPLGLPRFTAIADEDYAPAFAAAMDAHEAEIAAIAGSRAKPDFENVVTPMELAGKTLSRVSALFWNRAGAHTNAVIQALEREIAPKMSRHFSKIAQNRDLFERIDTVWRNRKQAVLTTEQLRVLERHWKGFVHAGAKLSEDGQKELAAINERLALLGAEFGQNILADESEWCLHLADEADLAGLPDFLVEVMAEAGREHGHEDGHAVTLSRSIIEPFLTFSERRELRETAFRAWISRGEGAHDNRPLVKEILQLRARKAAMLGYENYAAYKLDDTMAKTPGMVNELLEPVWEKALERAREEASTLEALLAQTGENHALEAWDWRFYAEKLRQKKFDFSETELKPYLQLDRIIEAAFNVAGRLFGLSFERRTDIAAYHPDVRVHEVRDSAGNVVGVFMGDYFARPSKRSGAWMSALQGGHKLDGGQIPFIYNVMNFAKAAPGQPTLLSLDDASTLFHEFGHALHGLLTQATYPSVSGTAVSRDFVELPSQLYEHWLTVPEVLTRYAVHYRTGEPIPQTLIDRVLAARNFNAGFRTVEYTASALVDMAFHTAPEVDDPMALEARRLAELDMPRAIAMRHRTPHFAHVFAGDGYSAGYYSYMWSEVLDADAFSAFEEAGDPFDKATADRLRNAIYASGGSVDPEDAYKHFRGKLPSPEAMMAKRGLA